MSDTESENHMHLAFSSGSSELYQPSSSAETSDPDVPGPSVPRRRARKEQNVGHAEENVVTNLERKKRKCANSSSWKRNLKKKSIAEGRAYIDWKGKPVGPRKVGPDCRCKKFKCFDKISEEKRNIILQKFNKIGDRDLQNTYLAGLISTGSVNRSRPRSDVRQRRGCSHTYKIKVGKETNRVCKAAFASIHGISKKRVENIAKVFNCPNITSPTCKQGKHHNRPNRISADLVEKIHSHIKSFPRRESHYGRKKSRCFYLSPDLNVRRMYNMYLERYETESISNTENKPKVTYDFYFRYFKQNFKYRFGSPRSDTCKKCDILENKLKGEIDDEEKKIIEYEKKQHLIKADIFFEELRKKTILCTEEDDIEVLSFDYQQNLPLPKITSGEAFYKRQLWTYNFCIYSGKTKKAHFYIYDETTARKSPNEVISFLNHYLNNILSKNTKILHLFSDNAAAQNKNSTIIQFLHLLIKKHNTIQKIIHHFPEPGHSFLPCDRCFGVIEKFLRKKDYIFSPKQYAQYIKETSKNFVPIMVNRSMVLDFTNHYKGHFKKTIVSDTRRIFKISLYKIFEYSKDHSDTISVSVSTGFPIFESFKLLRDLEDTLEVTPNLLAYQAPLLIKKAKYKDVMELATKYVPVNEMEFYRALKGEQHEGDQDQVSATDDDDQPDEQSEI